MSMFYFSNSSALHSCHNLFRSKKGNGDFRGKDTNNWQVVTCCLSNGYNVDNVYAYS